VSNPRRANGHRRDQSDAACWQRLRLLAVRSARRQDPEDPRPWQPRGWRGRARLARAESGL